MVGSVLGHYRVLRAIGKGGMGEVFAAQDLTLGRTVAIKVLPADLQARPVDRERFEREAKAIAALNHRSIVTIHSFEEANGVRFITMELVEGAPLSSRITGKSLSIDVLLQFGIELADAVSAAHDKGIVHRDLKPANVLVTADSHLKVLDFGLAKLRAPECVADDLPTQQATGEGKIVGTVAYMSPEQAEGKPVDQRTDIFSIGTMLYELATGQRPFQGDTSLSVLSAVIKDSPRSLLDLNPSLSPSFARVIKTCLQKDPERRYQSAKDLRNELRTLKEEVDSGDLARIEVVSMAPPRRWLPIAAGAAAALAVLGWILWRQVSATRPATVRLQHSKLTSTQGLERDPTLSPDGKWFLYVSGPASNLDIHLQSVGGQTAINLTKDSLENDTQPAFSPDGERIAFRSERGGGGLFVMGRTGEAPRRITSEGFDPTWSPDGRRLAYAMLSTTLPTGRVGLSALRIVDLETGKITPLVESDAMHPSWSPNGRFIAYWSMDSDSARLYRDLCVVPAAGGTPWRVTNDAHVDWSPSWSPDGAWLYFASNRGGSMNLWRLPMRADTGRPAGEPEAVTTPAQYTGRPRMAANGSHLIYESRSTTSNIHRVAIDVVRATIGNPEPVTLGSRAFRWVSPSPDGASLVLGTGYLQQEDLFVSRPDGSNLRPLTNDVFNDRFPEWSPRGDLIAFHTDRSGKYEIWTSTPEGQLRQLTDAPEYVATWPHWSPTGDRMIFSDSFSRRAVVMFDPRKPWKEQQPDVLPPPAGPGSYLQGTFVQWSPDGRELAGEVGGILTIYDIASRRYHRVPGDVRGTTLAWLRDGRLLTALGAPGPTTHALVDPRTGNVQMLSRTLVGAPTVLRLNHDETAGYFFVTNDDSDIWLVTLTSR
jgi:eukaryotic-like serine/threonine-protein kinase